MKSLLLILVLALLATAQEKPADVRIEPDYTWKADIDHSYISFRTMHWGIVELIGWFDNYDVTLKKDGDDWSTSKIRIVIDPKSVRMPNMGMAENLQLVGFFDSENYSEIVFLSNQVERLSDSNYIVTGDLTIKEKTRSIDWKVKFNGATHPPYGTPGFTAKSEFLLSDFDLVESQDSLKENYFEVGDSVFVRCSFRLRVEWD